MANVSSALQWSVIRKSSCFLIKRNGKNYTKEPSNLRGVNSYRYNGLVQEKTVGVEASADGKGVTLVTKNKNRNKPVKSHTRIPLKKNNSRRAFKTIMKTLKGQGYRKDLQAVRISSLPVVIPTIISYYC
ncbi:RPL28 [Bugula neritina]|uniref:Large ribosomal subunit protein eL28 n=1 Tax=Bugula neritina TaxID=10212 RepID=A0A7J7KK76_BUGNE|nr:RPL28 [Bugula neritina]